MRGIVAGSLGLLLGLWLGQSQAEEVHWRPASSGGPVTQRTADSPGPVPLCASLGRPVAAPAAADAPHDMRSIVSLGQPLPTTMPGSTPGVVDPRILPTSYSPELGTPASLIVRATSSDDLQPLPVGPPLKGPPIVDSEAEDNRKQAVTDKPPAGSGLVGIPGLCGSGAGDLAGCGDANCCDQPGWCGDGICGGLCDAGACPPHCVWLRSEYLLWNIRDSHSPPLLTTGPQASLGALGQPGTEVLFGGSIDHEEFSGGRFNLGLWLDPGQCFGVEGIFMFLGQRSVNFAASSNGVPVLARPIADAFTGREGVEQVANLQEIINGFGVLPLKGAVTVTAPSRLWGAEANGLVNLYRGCCYRLDLLSGFRYLNLDESINIAENLTTVAVQPFPPGVLFPPPFPVGTGFNVSDRFAAQDRFYGGQIGFRNEWYWRRWQVDLNCQVALGDSHETVDILGNTVIAVPGIPTSTFTGGLLAQPTNIGHFTRDRFAVVPEVSINLGYQFTDHWRAYVGYDFLYWSNVVRPGDQIDRTINVTQVPRLTGGAEALVGPARPAFAFHDTEFWANGVNFGLEFRY